MSSQAGRARSIPASCWQEIGFGGFGLSAEKASPSSLPVDSRVVAHIPERRRRGRGVTVACGGCTCTCTCCSCCCLHSIGGVVGAAIALSEPTPGLPAGAPAPRVTVLYFVVLQLLTALLVFHPTLSELGIMVLLFCLPGIQVATSILCYLIVALSHVPDKTHWYRKINQVTGQTILWTFYGGLATVVLGIAALVLR